MNEQYNNFKVIWECSLDDKIELMKLLAWPEEREQIKKQEQQEKDTMKAVSQLFKI